MSEPSVPERVWLRSPLYRPYWSDTPGDDDAFEYIRADAARELIDGGERRWTAAEIADAMHFAGLNVGQVTKVSQGLSGPTLTETTTK